MESIIISDHSTPTPTDDEMEEEGPQYDFGICKAKYIEHTNIFPEFPKTHKDGYATIIELDESILKDEKKVKELKTAMQYTLTREGHGNRTQSHVPYFGASQDQEESDEEEKSVSMQHSRRRCAGVKVCSHFPDELRGPHTEVDPEKGHTWAQLLSEQADREARGSISKAETLFNQYKDTRCEKVFPNGRICNGRTVLCAKNPNPFYDANRAPYRRMFIGCENWQGREDKHTHHFISNQDPIALLKLFGRDRSKVHLDILDSLGFSWADYDDEAGISQEYKLLIK
jgi:hypothetical protein